MHLQTSGRDVPKSCDDTALIERLKAGDELAYEILVRTFSSRLLAVARRLLGDEEDARDALQVAFISAFKALHRFQGGCQLSTWLHRIVVNAALMKLRSRKRHPEEPIDVLLPRFLEDGHQAEPASEWTAPERLLEQEQTARFVRACIGQLPESYRTVLMLRDIEELSTQETAVALGLTENAVKIRLHRARQALATLLNERFGGDARVRPRAPVSRADSRTGLPGRL
jgi:RNA polymerase sigma-70 factor (ECF subfamily)